MSKSTTFAWVIGVYQDGLDVSNPDVTTPEEIAAYRAQYTGSNRA